MLASENTFKAVNLAPFSCFKIHCFKVLLPYLKKNGYVYILLDGFGTCMGWVKLALRKYTPDDEWIKVFLSYNEINVFTKIFSSNCSRIDKLYDCRTHLRVVRKPQAPSFNVCLPLLLVCIFRLCIPLSLCMSAL